MPFRHCAHDLLLDLAALDDEQVWDPTYAIAGRYLRVVIDIDLHDLEPPGVFIRQIVDDRSDRTAGSAPWRPKIDQDRLGRLENFLLKTRIGHVDYLVVRHGLKIRTPNLSVKAQHA